MAYPRWDVQGQDVPGGRVTRSVETGLSDLEGDDRDDAIENRKDALDRLREAAEHAPSDDLRRSLWDLVPEIGKGNGHPTWEEVVAAQTLQDFRTLAVKAEGQRLQDSEGGSRDDEPAELRTMETGTREYIEAKEQAGISIERIRQDRSILGRAREVRDHRSDRPFGERRLVTLDEGDAELILDTLADSDDPRCEDGRVGPSTQENHKKRLKAWFNWEIAQERKRAKIERRDPLFSLNPFEEVEGALIQPVKDRHQTVDEANNSRRFKPHEADALIEEADGPHLEMLFRLSRTLGTRPGEPPHLRWEDDVRPLQDGDGYRIEIQGGRGRDPRCSCPQCCTKKGWAPKNGPRTYVLNREFDEIGWVTPLCDALDRWLAMRRPNPGDFILPAPTNSDRAWRNQEMNSALHATADRIRESGRIPNLKTGQDSPRSLTMHSWRHTCASEMLEAGIPDTMAADWIGDSLKEFRDTYGKPDPREIARATFRRNGASTVHKEVA